MAEIEIGLAEPEICRSGGETSSVDRARYVLPKFPLMDPMPEAWDDTPYKGPPARSPIPEMSMVDRALEAGEVELAASRLDEGASFSSFVQALNMRSWDDRLAAVRAVLAELRRHEAVHGPGSARKSDHPFARAMAWARQTGRFKESTEPASRQ